MTKPFLIPEPQCLGAGGHEGHKFSAAREASRGAAPSSRSRTWLARTLGHRVCRLPYRACLGFSGDSEASLKDTVRPCGALRDGPQPGGDIEGGAAPGYPTATAIASLALGPPSGSRPGPRVPFCRAKAVETAILQTQARPQAGARRGSRGMGQTCLRSLAVSHGPSGERVPSGLTEADAWAVPQQAPRLLEHVWHPSLFPHALGGCLSVTCPETASLSFDCGGADSSGSREGKKGGETAEKLGVPGTLLPGGRAAPWTRARLRGCDVGFPRPLTDS